MRQLCRIIVICALLIIKSTVYAQTPVNQGGYITFNINEGATIVLHGSADHAAAYQWFKDGVRIPGAISKDYTANAAGIYSVMAFNAEGCPSVMAEGVRIVINQTQPPVTKPDTVVDLTVNIQSTNTKAGRAIALLIY
jgi:hypothetical protein